jgi:hypothetical protein
MMETKVCNLGPLQLNSGTDTVLLNNLTKVGDLIVSRMSWFYSINFFFIFLAEVSGPRTDTAPLLMATFQLRRALPPWLSMHS